MIGFHEVGKNTDEVVEQFKGAVPTDYVTQVKQELGI